MIACKKYQPFITLSLMISSLLWTNFACAQADRIGNGGNWSEADLKHFITRLVPYLKSEEGKAVFPEAAEYDSKAGENTIEKIAGELHPRLVSRKVYDSRGNERDCISYVKPERYFECNLNALPPKPDSSANHDQKSEYFGSLYRLALHEIFVQAGLEKPLIKEVPSEYLISSRLLVHLESYPEWVPGAAVPPTEVDQNDISIRTQPIWSVGIGAGRANYATAAGALIKLQFPVKARVSAFKIGLTSGYQTGLQKDSNWSIPVLLSVEFEWKKQGGLSSYLGLGVGGAIVNRMYRYPSTFVSLDGTVSPGPLISNRSTEFYFAVQVSPGLNFGVNNKYFFEIPCSYYSHDYSIMPSLGIHF